MISFASYASRNIIFCLYDFSLYLGMVLRKYLSEHHKT